MKTLKQNIRKSLVEVKEQKRVLVIEEKIIKNRFGLLVESFENHQNTDLLFDNLITETRYLQGQNYNEELLNESILDFFKNLLPRLGGGTIDMFQEYLVKGIIRGLGLDPNSTWAIVIKNAIANVDMADIPKLAKLDCNYITELITRTTVETMIDKMKFFQEHDQFGSILKNTLDSYFRHNFSDEFQKFLSGPLCKLLGGFSSKIENQVDNIRRAAVATSPQGSVQPAI